MRKKINSLEDLPDLTFDCILLTTIKAQQRVREKIMGMGIAEEKIKVLE